MVIYRVPVWVVCLLILAAAPALPLSAQVVSTTRTEYLLDGEWEIRPEGDEDWRRVVVPGTFEESLGYEFDGVATYRRRVAPVALAEGRRLILHFDAVATHATVRFNGVQVGEHLGGWTPFRMDVTDAARTRPDADWEIEVLVDERVGHNTQGFLPIIAPHFGGIWQSVRLLDVPEAWIDETQMLAVGLVENEAVQLAVPVHGSGAPRLSVEIIAPGGDDWVPIAAATEPEPVQEGDVVTVRGQWSLDVAGGGPPARAAAPEGRAARESGLQLWSPDRPARYRLRVTVGTGESADVIETFVAFREIRTDGDGFLLNGSPVGIRGILNWGYAPPRNAPSLDEDFMKKEIESARQNGFNLMKFCLWVPPRRYFELCDEMGMLAWQEYPTWHPDFSPARLEELRREYDEFFAHDRNHPSVVLRSLTCETGPSADLGVIRALYERCKDQVPGAIVVDDSSWIAWNRVFDFYDDHPYGNNHTWVATLGRLKQYIAERETKPLVLGEAITGDTWTPPAWFGEASPERWWEPDFLESSRQWEAEAERQYGAHALQWLHFDSLRYSLSMRKWQIETYRREIPRGGYVMSVMRDVRNAAMGMFDFRGEPKWEPDDWSWHGDRVLLAETPHDRIGLAGGSTVRFRLRLSGPGGYEPFPETPSFFLATPQGVSECDMHDDAGPEDDGLCRDFHCTMPDVDQPIEAVVFAFVPDLENAPGYLINAWTVWIIPETEDSGNEVRLHDSARDLESLLGETGWNAERFAAEGDGGRSPVVTRVVDAPIIDVLERGGSVLMLPADLPGSFPLESYWFLRGGPVLTDRFGAIGSEDRTGWLAPRHMLVDLQHFDLAGDVIRNVDYLNNIDPLVMLWENHDLDVTRTNGLVFHMPVGEAGHLLVSALRHDGEGNIAGRYLLGRLLLALKDPAATFAGGTAAGPQNLERLRRECTSRRIALEHEAWKFQPDPDNLGTESRWFAPDLDDAGWTAIRIDRHWESQGHDTLDNWAWYRLKLKIPEDWNSPQAFLNFTGVDDYYELYVNGELAGSAGNIETRETAFDMRTSHEITRWVEPGKTLVIAVRVYDWYGAGGIFRPVEFSSEPLSEGRRMLK